jgi:hypothetical protein
VSNRGLENGIVAYLDEHGPTGRATLADAMEARPQQISQALFGLKQLGLVVPVGDGRWATQGSPIEFHARALATEIAKLPEGEGEPEVRRVETEDQAQIPDCTPTTRERVDGDDLVGCLFNAEGILRRALDEWLATDPVARQLTSAIRACQAAQLAVDELTP